MDKSQGKERCPDGMTIFTIEIAAMKAAIFRYRAVAVPASGRTGNGCRWKQG